MIDGWEWDETLFSGAAAHYARGRLPYAPGLAEALADALRLDGRGRLLDVGCGPGTIALTLADLFREVVGVDPDGGMIAEAGREAARAGLTGKTRWVRARAEDLPAGLGTFTAVGFAQSFHWMDRDLVAATVRDMLRPGGVLLHISDVKTAPPTAEALPHPAPPRAAIDDLVRKYLGPVRRAGRGTLPQGTPGDEATVFTRAGFTGPDHHVVPGGGPLTRDRDALVAEVYSMSFSAPHLFGPHRPAFEADLRRVLQEASPSGRFSQHWPDTEVFVWHKGPTGPESGDAA